MGVPVSHAERRRVASVRPSHLSIPIQFFTFMLLCSHFSVPHSFSFCVAWFFFFELCVLLGVGVCVFLCVWWWAVLLWFRLVGFVVLVFRTHRTVFGRWYF